MQTLFLDLASHFGLIACVADDTVISSKEVDHRISDSEIIPTIESVLQDAGRSYKDLTQIACVVGPGGFTSLRVAVSCTNALMWSLSIPGVGIHLSDLYAARAELPTTTYNLPSSAWLHSTKKHELFIREFWNEFSLYSNPTHITLEELQKFLKSETQWMGELIQEHRDIVEEKKLKEIDLKPIQEILPVFLSSLEYSQKQLEPWYGRGW